MPLRQWEKSGDSGILMRTPPAGGGVLFRANEPGGMTLIAQRAFNARNEDPAWNDVVFNPAFISDASAPYSPSGIARATYPAGMGGGIATDKSEVYFGGTPYRTIYCCYVARLSANFQGHSSGVNKQAYFFTPAFSGLFYFSAQGIGAGPLQPQMRTQNLITPPGDDNWPPNVPGQTGATIPRNAWYQIETLATGNTAGNADGVADFWLDGVHIGHYSGIQWETGASTWGYFQWYNGWGGTGDTVAADMTLDFDHEYVSGKN